MALSVEYYTEKNEQEWDKFVSVYSMNGTFLQTRRFINYHSVDKFKDCSLCVRKGKELVAVCLGCKVEVEGETYFWGHQGSTFGGICVSEKIYSATLMNELIEAIEEFLISENFTKIYYKIVPAIFQRKSSELIDYFLYKKNYHCYSELNYYLTLSKFGDNVIGQFSSSKRRDYRYALKYNLKFLKLTEKEEIREYYSVLHKNLKRLNVNVVHSLEDLFDLFYNRFPYEIEFYAVKFDNKIIAGSMIFLFDKRIFHTQYLSSDERYLKLYPMDFLIKNLIETAIENNYHYFSFGISTEDRGKYLNFGLSKFKEGFGAEFAINRSYEKKLEYKK